jgi:hypothetical protein
MMGANDLCCAPAYPEGRGTCGVLVFNIFFEGEVTEARGIMLRASAYGALAIVTICPVPSLRRRRPIQDIGIDEHTIVMRRA